MTSGQPPVPVELKTEAEILLRVPKDLALVSLGFAIDAGGSVTKLLYRSKEDYSNGKRIAKVDHDDGLLRLRHLATEDDEDIVTFIRDRCDVMESAKSQSESWFVTGVKTQRIKKRLEETFEIKVKTLTEMDAIYRGLNGFYSHLSDCRPLSLSQEAVDQALNMTKGFLQMMNSAKQVGDSSFEELKDKVDPVAVGQYAMKLMTTDAVTLNQELSAKVIEWPCLNVICGSAVGLIIMKGSGRFEIGSFLPVGGKSFMGFGRLLCGAKNFEELIEMAARGDHRKVDVMTSDMRATSDQEDDWYSNLPDSMVTYSMGKLVENSTSNNYSKDDLAAGLLNVICCSIAKLAVALARQSKIKCVVFDGSLVNSETVRCTLQRWLLFDSMIQPLIGEEPIKWIFLPHPGFVCAFGTWNRNFELEKGLPKN